MDKTWSARQAGWVLSSGPIVDIVWQLLIAPAILDNHSVEYMPATQRAVSAIGLLAGAVLTVVGQVILARALRRTRSGWLVASASYAALIGMNVLTVGFLVRLADPQSVLPLWVFFFLTTGSWIVTSAVLISGGILRWSALASAVLSVLTIIAILEAGAPFIVIWAPFIFIALLPMAAGLTSSTP